MTRFIAAALIATTLAASARAQDALSGTWEGKTGSGAAIVLTLAVKDTALTGTLVRDGQSVPLSDGKVSKNTFTFKLTLNNETEGFSGERAENEIRIWIDRQGRESAIVLQRATQK
jgi:opacity protein-like surface antigen